MLAAEGYIRAGQFAQAATLINISRVRNGLPAISGHHVRDAADRHGAGCVPRVPQPPSFTSTACGTILEAMKYEKRMETAYTGYMIWFTDSRGWGDLIATTPYEWPVPYQEMQARQLPFYNGTDRGAGRARTASSEHARHPRDWSTRVPADSCSAAVCAAYVWRSSGDATRTCPCSRRRRRCRNAGGHADGSRAPDACRAARVRTWSRWRERCSRRRHGVVLAVSGIKDVRGGSAIWSGGASGDPGRGHPRVPAAEAVEGQDVPARRRRRSRRSRSSPSAPRSICSAMIRPTVARSGRRLTGETSYKAPVGGILPLPCFSRH